MTEYHFIYASFRVSTRLDAKTLHIDGSN